MKRVILTTAHGLPYGDTGELYEKDGYNLLELVTSLKMYYDLALRTAVVRGPVQHFRECGCGLFWGADIGEVMVEHPDPVHSVSWLFEYSVTAIRIYAPLTLPDGEIWESRGLIAHSLLNLHTVIERCVEIEEEWARTELIGTH